jgi:hypothetical protein
MDALGKLHQTLKVAASLLDSAAGQIRDAALSPTKTHIHSIGEALVSIFEIQHAIYKLRPELEPKHEETSQEDSLANRRLGETLIAAYDLADNERLSEAIALLATFVANDSSEFHRELVAIELERLSRNYGP